MHRICLTHGSHGHEFSASVVSGSLARARSSRRLGIAFARKKKRRGRFLMIDELFRLVSAPFEEYRQRPQDAICAQTCYRWSTPLGVSPIVVSDRYPIAKTQRLAPSLRCAEDE